MRIGKPQFTNDIQSYVQLVDERSSGTNGGDTTGGTWNPRAINTEKSDVGGIASIISSTQFTLVAGSYYTNISAPGYLVGRHQLRLWNVTDGAVVSSLSGSSEFANTTDYITTKAFLAGMFNISSTKTFEIQHYTEGTTSLIGFGVAVGSGAPEVYTIAEFWRDNA